MKELKPNKARAKNAIILIWIVLAMEVLSIISGYLQYDLLQSAANGGMIPMDVADSNDAREQLIGVLYTVSFLISGIFFILWFRRAYFNLHQKINYLSYSEGWAAGSWFVPILNLFRPVKIMSELYQETQELLIKKGLLKHKKLKSGILSFWWALWIINGFIGQLVFQYAMSAESIDNFVTMTMFGLVANIVGVPLALITIKIITDYAKIEPLLFEIDDDEQNKSVNTPNIGDSTTLLDD